ncbi:MAG: hypothetical protein ACFFD4_09610 [Candidatus Odinarchaeota archaeon]
MNETIELKEAFLLMMEERSVRGGSNASLGRILGLLLIEDRPLDQKELAYLSGYTKAHVSKVLNQLLLAGIIEKSVEASSSPGRPRLMYKLDKQGYDIVQPGILTTIHSLNHTRGRLLEMKNGSFQGKMIKSKEEDSHIMNIVDIYIDYIKRMVEILEDALKKANPRG